MKFVLALFALVCLWFIHTPAHAFGIGAPPERYQGPAENAYISMLPLEQVQKRCGNKTYPLTVTYGCAYVSPNRCSVYIIDKPTPHIGFPFGPPVVYPEDILEHELGHCNGWPGHHPN